MISGIKRDFVGSLRASLAVLVMLGLSPVAAQTAEGAWDYEEIESVNRKIDTDFVLNYAYGIPIDEEILLIISCDQSELYVIAQPQWWLTLDESITVRYRFDSGEVTHDKWDVLMQQQAVQRGTAAIEFANLMVTSKTLALEIGNRLSEFDLQGSYTALSPVFEQCNIRYLF